MRIFKRTLSLLLAAVMLLTVLPLTGAKLEANAMSQDDAFEKLEKFMVNNSVYHETENEMDLYVGSFVVENNLGIGIGYTKYPSLNAKEVRINVTGYCPDVWVEYDLYMGDLEGNSSEIGTEYGTYRPKYDSAYQFTTVETFGYQYDVIGIIENRSYDGTNIKSNGWENCYNEMLGQYQTYEESGFKELALLYCLSNPTPDSPTYSNFITNINDIMFYALKEIDELLSVKAGIGLGDFGFTIFSGNQPSATDITVRDMELNYKDFDYIYPEFADGDSTDYTVKYESSDTNVAAVKDDGYVSAVGPGTATITCTVTDNDGNVSIGKCKVTVKYTWWQWLIRIFLLGFLWY